MYRVVFVDYWHWLAGGAAIGLLVPGMYYFLDTALGVSTGYGNLLKRVMPKTKLKYLRSSKFSSETDVRLWLIGGMVLGGFLSRLLQGGFLPTLEMGLFTQATGWAFWQYGLFFFFGGILIGFGASMAGGCTSGNSIGGIATGQKGSAVATLFFLAAGALVANLVRVFFAGGSGL